MAVEGALKELCEEASCSICLEFFKDPVTIAECGHSFCRACLTRSWGESSAAASCPLCKRRAVKRKLRPNQQLANFVEIAKKLRPLEGAEAKGGEGQAGACEKHQEPLKFVCKEDGAFLCAACRRSREHRDHEETPLEQAAGEREAVGAAGQERVCQKHQETLKLFCKDDKALICVVCDRSKEHRDHETLPLEEASQGYKDARSTLQRYEEKEAFENPVAFPLALKWRIWDCSDINHLLAGITKQLKDTLGCGLHLKKANVTLDPDTACPGLTLSKNLKSVREEEEEEEDDDYDDDDDQALPTNPERFDEFGTVLGREGFTAGRHFWEVLVGSEEEWSVGVARKSVRRTRGEIFSSEDGKWVNGGAATRLM